MGKSKTCIILAGCPYLVHIRYTRKKIVSKGGEKNTMALPTTTNVVRLHTCVP
jgi:hypothetical protein